MDGWFTDYVGNIPTVGESAGRASRKVNAVRQVVDFGGGVERVVVAIVDQWVPKNEETRKLWCTSNTRKFGNQQQREAGDGDGDNVWVRHGDQWWWWWSVVVD